MAMSDYEPASGWNLPPGCFEGDPRAPWNVPDPWEGRSCGECRNCSECKLLDGTKIKVCTCDGCDLEEIEPDAPACEGFEDY